jgi:hypothetical protein
MSEVDVIEQVRPTSDEHLTKNLDVRQAYWYPRLYPLCQFIHFDVGTQ